jgi:hypothetical protein
MENTMNQTKHTQGPLRAVKSTAREFSHFIDAGPAIGSQFIAAVANGLDLDRDAANARLIAAAPDLLAALVEIEMISSNGAGMIHETGKPTWSLAEAVSSLARAALAQASA